MIFAKNFLSSPEKTHSDLFRFQEICPIFAKNTANRFWTQHLDCLRKNNVSASQVSFLKYLHCMQFFSTPLRIIESVLKIVKILKAYFLLSFRRLWFWPVDSWCCIYNLKTFATKRVALPCFFLSLSFVLAVSKPVFPKLCAAAHWCAAEEAEVWRESFMFWQNLLYVTSLPLESLWRVGFYEVGVPRPNPIFIIVCRNEIKFEKRCSKPSLQRLVSHQLTAFTCSASNPVKNQQPSSPATHLPVCLQHFSFTSC